MKDIVEAALEHAEREGRQQAPDTDASEFGSPQFTYVGCGDRGCKRIDDGLSDRSFDLELQTPLEDLVTTVRVGDEFEVDSELVSNQFDLAGTAAAASGGDSSILEALEELISPADVCLFTLSLTDAEAVAATTELATLPEETPTMVFASTDGDHSSGALQRLTTTANTTVPFDESVISEGPLGTSEASSDILVDQFVQRFVTDVVELPTVPTRIGIDYTDVWEQWQHGGLAVPVVARLDRHDLDVETISEAITPLAQTDGVASGWVGYAIGGKNVQLSEFNRLRKNLPQALDGQLRFEDGVLGGRIREGWGDRILLSVLQTGMDL